MEQREFIVEQETAGQRIDRFLSGEDTGLSRSALQALVAEGHVQCNGKTVAKSLKLKAGDTVLLEIPDAKPIEAVPQDIPLDIVYEDAHLLVVNKPKGMVVHPAPGNPDGTLVNALLWHCKGSLSGIGGEIRPGIVHRIDKDTSGLLVVAKDDATHIGLSQQMAVHSVERAYQTVVYGGFAQDEGFVEANLGRSKTDRKKMAVYPATEPHTKYAYTGYKVLERLGEFTLLECRLKTGRTHQIRVHMASIHHPVAGDPVYGPHNCITSLHVPFCERTFYPFFHHSTSFLCTGGLVSKACSNSSKTGCICTTPTRPYKSCNKHCPFSKSRKRFWLFSSSLSMPKNSKVCFISLMSVLLNANFKPILFFRLSFATSPEDCVTK